MLFSNLFKTGINVTSKRFARRKVNLRSWPNDWVPFYWKRPEKTAGYFVTGDLINLENPTEKQLQTNVETSQELNQLDVANPIRKIYSLDHAKRSHHNKAKVFEHMKELGLIHEVDYPNSLEAKIINLTYTLRNIQEMIKPLGGEAGRYNGHLRMAANSVSYRRYRYLCELKELHKERYERCLESLKIEPKLNEINVPFLKPFRKKLMRKLAIEYARDMKEKKVEEFMKVLEKEKVAFEKEKLETMKWIEEQERKLSVTV